MVCKVLTQLTRKYASSNMEDKTLEKIKIKDVSLRSKRHEKVTIDTALVSESQSHFKMVKIKTKDVRIPQIGDKFASRHGQKGTCGMIDNPENLPYTIDGIIPDMIVNPHCIPSRMTIGHVL